MCEQIHIREQLKHECEDYFTLTITSSHAIEHRNSFTFENLKLIPIQGEYNPEYG